MLKKDPKDRISMDEAMSHEWFHKQHVDEEQPIDQKILERMKGFRA